MKKVLTISIVLILAFAFAVPVQALNIPVSNNVYLFEAGAFEAVDGWYLGEINVGWHGNGNNTADLTWAGNEGEVIVTPYTVESNQQRAGTLGIQIQQTTQEQTVVFTLTKVNNKTLDVTVVVPALYSGPISFDVLRTAIDPGYYFSGALVHMGVTLTNDAVDKDTFYAKARVTEGNGVVEVEYGNNRWDPEKASYELEDGFARWNILDAYVTDADGNPVDKGEYVKLDIEWDPRSEPVGATGYARYEVPATRAGWYRGSAASYFAYATIELEITQQKEVPGIASANYVQDETKHDPLFEKFEISEFPGGYVYGLYTPDNASEDNKRPIFIWFHGTGERYYGGNPGANLVANRVVAFAEEEFQQTLGGAYVLAPQSTTAGFNASVVNDMEALINMVITENHVDPDRIYVGGLSMGTGMTVPLITSQTGNQINYAAAILSSGGFINATQAQTIASKGIAVYLLGNAGDFAAFSQPAAYNNLVAAGADAKIYRYPSGPTFDGKYYYGAHDTWIYFYNNQVVDENGETMFEWLASKSR